MKKIIKALMSAALVITMIPMSNVFAASEFEGESWYDQITTVQENREYAH